MTLKIIKDFAHNKAILINERNLKSLSKVNTCTYLYALNFFYPRHDSGYFGFSGLHRYPLTLDVIAGAYKIVQLQPCYHTFIHPHPPPPCLLLQKTRIQI